MLSFVKQLIFPPHCAGCGSCLAPSFAGDPPLLCKECEAEWERELRAQCPKCHADYPECDCMPVAMKRAGIAHFVKLVPYGEGANRRVARHMILSMKTASRTRLCAFLAGELAGGVQRALEECECAATDAVIAHLPRDQRTVRRYGVDQAKELAMALSLQTGISHATLFRRKKRVKKQKTLSEKERMLNLVEAFALESTPTQKCVILVDDIVTTGASMAVPARLLRTLGITQVIAVAPAHTEKKK